MTLLLKKYDCGVGSTTICHDVSLACPHAGVYLLTGPNGSGKSTLLASIRGWREERSIDARGVLLHDGDDISAASLQERGSRGFYLLPQHPAQSLHATTVLDEVASRLLYHGSSWSESTAFARDALAALGASPLTDRAVDTLSAGEQQVAALASIDAALRRTQGLTPVILLDEPTSFLDGERRRRYREFLQRWRRHAVVLVATHLAAGEHARPDGVFQLRGGAVTRRRDAPRPEPAALSEAAPITGDWLCCEDLSFRYSVEPVLSRFSCRFPERGLALVTGPNGSGKTTLGLLLAGVFRPRRGRILVGGKRVGLGALRALCAYAPQDPRAFFFTSSVDNEARLIAEYNNEPRGRLRQVEELLRPWWQRSPGTLSGGERRIVVNILLSTLLDRSVLIVDEPEFGLDPEAFSTHVAMLRDAALKRLVIIISHDPRIIGLPCAHRVTLRPEGAK